MGGNHTLLFSIPFSLHKLPVYLMLKQVGESPNGTQYSQFKQLAKFLKVAMMCKHQGMNTL